MKKKKMFIALFVIAVLMAGSAALLTAASPKSEPVGTETIEQEKVTPSAINTQTNQSGKVTIYQDGEVMYEYEGPIEIRRREGRYRIEVQTFSCSCYGSEVDE